MTTEEMIAIMQHFAGGGEVEVSINGKTNWLKCPEPLWNWANNSYRIKRVPRECWVNIYNSGKVGTPHFSLEVSKTAAKRPDGLNSDGLKERIHYIEVIE